MNINNISFYKTVDFSAFSDFPYVIVHPDYIVQNKKTTWVHNEESESCLSCMWHAYWSLFIPIKYESNPLKNKGNI